ncbi:hypothetical protein K2173_015289 [Erythroxylum novogranatense]|uniref:Protein FAR1-RELATED SEQUENCE n=1 Tax=Erythroxylum novogranatense TaxID=1862640 RepID=A0AAV8T1S5_9ROSI|nr:hypothetical protein K2173_015289 [Erythroxylum novogranatense]
MDELSLNTKTTGDDDADELEMDGDCAMIEYVGQPGVIDRENPLPPAVGMEFESYEDVYYFYNCYAKEQGFGIRVSNTWYRKGKERYRGKLSCSSAGFKKKSEANRPRPETRTGCPAMIKFRLMENKRWRIIEVELGHNHITSPASGKFFKSHKLIGAGSKRAMQFDGPEEVEKIRLFQTVIVNPEKNGIVEDDGQFADLVVLPKQLNLKEGKALAIQNFFCDLQLMDPNFFYVVDLNEKGYMKNLFWAGTRARVAYGYFGDVVAIDTTCLTEKYEVPLVSFTGVNHHGKPILLGCGLVAGETTESYTWLLRAWLTCMLGRPPQVIITNQCKILQTVVADVFPRASHCIYLASIMQKFSENLGGILEHEEIRITLTKVIYNFLRPEEFETAWEEMAKRHGIKDHGWIQSIYEQRKQWVPAYVKEKFLAGMLPLQQNETVISVFRGYLDKHTSLKEFLDKYDQALQENHRLEALADVDSGNSSFTQKPRCYFEVQLSKLYTNEILRGFAKEVEGMYSCFNIRQENIDEPAITYMVKEQVEVGGGGQERKDFEVIYNVLEMDALCICGLFNIRGYLCRHALSVFKHNGVEEIPPQYILTRWRKDIKRSYVLNHNCAGIDINNPVHRYDHLYKRIVQVVEEGRKSEEHYKIALQGLQEILNKLHLAKD